MGVGIAERVRSEVRNFNDVRLPNHRGFLASEIRSEAALEEIFRTLYFLPRFFLDLADPLNTHNDTKLIWQSSFAAVCKTSLHKPELPGGQ